MLFLKLIYSQFDAHRPAQIGNHWVGNLVKNKGPLAPTAQDTGSVEHAEVTGYIGLGQAGQLHDVLDRPLIGADRLNDAQASRFGEQCKILGGAIKNETKLILVISKTIGNANRPGRAAQSASLRTGLNRR